MMIKSILLFLSAVPLTEAFIAISPGRKLLKVTLAATRSSSADYDSETAALTKLQKEYKVLQERLYADVVLKHDLQDAEQVEEQMIEKLIEADHILEDHQRDIIEEADEIQMNAQKTRQRAQDIKIAEKEKAKDEDTVFEIEAAYEDLVRYSDFKELEAIDKKEAAVTLLKELKENEKRLEATLEALHQEYKKDPDTRSASATNIHAQHRSFLDAIKAAIYSHPDILINLDPHIL